MKQNIESLIAAKCLLVWWEILFCASTWSWYFTDQKDNSYWCAWLCTWTKDNKKEILLLRTWTSGFPYCLCSPIQFRLLHLIFLRVKAQALFYMSYRGVSVGKLPATAGSSL